MGADTSLEPAPGFSTCLLELVAHAAAIPAGGGWSRACSALWGCHQDPGHVLPPGPSRLTFWDWGCFVDVTVAWGI